jgi:hypothetical protein
MISASAVDGICIHVVINAVSVTISIVVAVSIALAIPVANHHFFQDLLID